jgi:hypothetical protein
MKFPAFDHANAKWDAFKRFYIQHGPGYDHGYGSSRPFVQFDTGEVIVTRHKFDPDERHVYKDLGIAVYGTADDKCPTFTTPDGETVLKSWLTYLGQQIVLADLGTRKVVRMDYHRYEDPIDCPSDLRPNARAYFAGEGRDPVGRAVKVARPTARTKEEKAHVQSMIDASKMWAEILPSDQRHTYPSKPLDFDHVLKGEFKDFGRSERLQMIHKGVVNGYTTVSHPYLLLKE